MWTLARTPRWIAALVFALIVAAGFAALGQWQLSRAVASGTVIQRSTETVVPIESVAKPQQPVTDKAAGQKVRVNGTFVPGTATLLKGRLNHGDSGYWVMAELRTGSGAAGNPSLAVALGWTADEATATSALDQADHIIGAQTVVGRFITGEDPTGDDFEHGQHKTASVSALINEWPNAPDGVYNGYVVDDAALAGLEKIDSPKPSTQVTLNLLNVFYAIEWVVFAGLAIFMWYRLVKDAYERQLEEEEELNAKPVDVN